MTQTKILRVLQSQEFERVGGNELIRTDVRLLAATNRHLEKMVAAGKFRGDLYYRLNVFSIRLPPLRERLEDVPLLAAHFTRRFAKELEKDVHRIDDKTLEILKEYSWPGNVREFQSVIKQALLHATGPVLLPEFLPESVRERRAAAGESLAEAPDLSALSTFIQQRLAAGSTSLYSEFQAFTDQHLLKLVLQHTHNNLTQSARVLGITRSTLRSKLRTLGLVSEGDTTGD